MSALLLAFKAFTAAVIGLHCSLPGACLGGLIPWLSEPCLLVDQFLIIRLVFSIIIIGSRF